MQYICQLCGLCVGLGLCNVCVRVRVRVLVGKGFVMCGCVGVMCLCRDLCMYGFCNMCGYVRFFNM